MYIPILLGTGREGRFSEKAANFILDQAKKFGFDSEIYDVRDYNSPVTIPSWVENKRVGKWKEMVKKADGLIIVSPEYNHGYPGELKIVLDSLYKEYEKLPVALCATSNGRFGGSRMVENILPVLNAFSMLVVPKPFYISNIEEVFDENGALQDEKYTERCQKFFSLLKDYINLTKK